MTPSTPSPIHFSASLSYANGSIQSQALQVGQKNATITGKHFVAATMSVPATAGGTLIPVGALSSLGFAMFVNNDPSNTVIVLSGVGGVEFAQMLPGEPLLIRLGSGVTAPALVASGGPAEVEYLILES